VAYKKEDLLKQALEVIDKHGCIFIEEVVAYLPCSKPTFYELKLNESNELKEAIYKYKIEKKAGLRDKWYESDNATTQMALYKLLSTDEEHKKLSQNYYSFENEDITGDVVKLT